MVFRDDGDAKQKVAFAMQNKNNPATFPF